MTPRRSSKLTVSVPVQDIFVRLATPKLSLNSFDSPVRVSIHSYSWGHTEKAPFMGASSFLCDPKGWISELYKNHSLIKLSISDMQSLGFSQRIISNVA